MVPPGQYSLDGWREPFPDSPVAQHPGAPGQAGTGGGALILPAM